MLTPPLAKKATSDAPYRNYSGGHIADCDDAACVPERFVTGQVRARRDCQNGNAKKR